MENVGDVTLLILLGYFLFAEKYVPDGVLKIILDVVLIVLLVVIAIEKFLYLYLYFRERKQT
ncbi:hypothetical protein WAK64_08065 [Bacillus spongiae]|uniref:Uncharacterized protein n=1 Tax=Bacillus spongiae TaxID=2683610 RepID=A0ABU8HCK7_9BACI